MKNMNNQPPLLSVVVPVHNAAHHIDEAPQSLLHQTVRFYQIIVVEDGSTDGPKGRLAWYAHHDTAPIPQSAHSGPRPACNEGWRHATGDYVYFLDQGDLLTPDFVARVSALIQAHAGLDLVFFSGETLLDAPPRPFPGVYPDGLDDVSAMLETGLLAPGARVYASQRALWGEVRFKSVAREHDEVIARLCACASDGRHTGCPVPSTDPVRAGHERRRALTRCRRRLLRPRIDLVDQLANGLSAAPPRSASAVPRASPAVPTCLPGSASPRRLGNCCSC
jgi:hypothetical protein